jgi:hypothetical protein
MTLASLNQRFARSKFGPPTFLALMAICGWFAIRSFRQSLSFPVARAVDFSIIIIATFLSWTMMTRQFSFWTRWVVSWIAFAVCGILSAEAGKHMALAIGRSDQGLRAALFFAAFFGVTLLWIVLIPVEEAVYRAGTVPRGRLRFWPLSFAVAGVAMIAYAGLIFAHHLESLSQNPSLHELIATKNVAIYLVWAFVVLLLARMLSPLLHARPKKIRARMDPSIEAHHT